MIEGDNIGRIIILELTEHDSSAFEDILSFLSRHPDLKKWELRDEPILSLHGLEINLARRKITSDGREIQLTAKEYDIFRVRQDQEYISEFDKQTEKYFKGE